MRRREKAREGGRRREKAGECHQHVPAVLNEITALYVSTTGCGTPAAVGAAARRVDRGFDVGHADLDEDLVLMRWR